MYDLDFWGNVAAIGTAVTGLGYWLFTRITLHRHTRAIEAVLEQQADSYTNSLDEMQIGHLIGLTESQVIAAASRSKRIEPVDLDNSGYCYRFIRPNRGRL